VIIEEAAASFAEEGALQEKPDFALSRVKTERLRCCCVSAERKGGGCLRWCRRPAVWKGNSPFGLSAPSEHARTAKRRPHQK